MPNKVAPWIRTARVASWWLMKDDFYWPDYDIQEEIVRRAAHFAANGVNMVVIFGFHFRWDYVPYFERIRSLFRRITEECHRHGIHVCDHYSDTLIHRPRNDEDRWFLRERANHHVVIYPDCDQDFAFEGTFRESWSQIDVRTNESVYFENYRCHAFCPNNPDFQRASLVYARRQLDETGMDGLMNDDLHFLPDYHACACKHCRERFRTEWGHELPPVEDREFWGNQENPAFRDWIAMRLRSTGDHYVRLRKELGPERPLFACCCETSSRRVVDKAMVCDEFSRGCNVTSMEMMGLNPVGRWRDIHASQAVFQAIASGGDFLRGDAAHVLDVEEPDPFVPLIYAEVPQQFSMCWAMQVAWGARSWVSKRNQARNDLEARAVYDDESHLADSLKWQAAHEDLYVGTRRVADVGVIFSPATRNFASPEEANAHRAEHILWTQLMADHGVLSEAVLAQALCGSEAGNKLARRYSLILAPRVVATDDLELEGLLGYLVTAGNVLVTGTMGTHTAEGARRQSPLLDRLIEQSGHICQRLVHLPESSIEKTSYGCYEAGQVYRDPPERPAAVKKCLDIICRLIPNPIFEPSTDAAGWSFHLYRRGATLFLHCLNLSGTVPVDGSEILDDRSLPFNIPASGVIECRIRPTAGKAFRARLFSPDGAEGDPVEISREGDWVGLRVPVTNARRYAIVVIESEDSDK